MADRIPQLDLPAEWAEVGPAVEEAVLRVLRSGQYVLGPETAALEAEVAAFTGTRFCVGVGSGTEALILALRALGVGPGDEVVTTAFTYFATVEAILWCDATPVFVDIEPDSYNLDPRGLAAAIGPRTRAILPVHLFGRCADMTAIRRVADAHGLPVVEDAAQAIGAERDGRRTGSFGAAGCFSFYPSKNLGAAGDAGCVTTDDEAVAEKLRLLRAHGCKVRDDHRVLGTTSRLDSVQAAVLRAKLPHLPRWTKARARAAARYAELLSGIPGVTLPGAGASEAPVWNQFTIRCDDPLPIRAALDSDSIEWRHYYPIPAYRQYVLGAHALAAGTHPHAERAAAGVISLPMHAFLEDSTIDRIARAVRRGAGN